MIAGVDGQAVSIGGLKDTTGAVVVPWGVGGGVIDQSIAATGFTNANVAINGRGSVPYAAQYAYVRDQIVAGNEGVGVVIGDNGFGGLLVEKFTLADAESYAENQRYWMAEAKRLAVASGMTIDAPFLLHFIGTSGKVDAYDYWRSKAQTAWDEHIAYMSILFGEAPMPVVVQTGGDVNTVADLYHPTQAQYDMARAYGGHLLTSQRIWPISDLNIHPDVPTRLLIGETCAWAMAEILAGRKWTPWVTVTKSGATVTVQFDLRPSETLTERVGLYEANGGDAATAPNLGFEADGGISAATFSGDTVTLTLANPTATWLRFAYQFQNVSATGDANGYTFSAHRSTLFPSETKDSKFYPGQTLWRSLPSFRGAFAGDTFVFDLDAAYQGTVQ